MIKKFLGFDDQAPITMSLFRLLVAAALIGWGANAWGAKHFVPIDDYNKHCEAQTETEKLNHALLQETHDIVIAMKSAMKQRGYQF